ncbi:hypothetical protein AGMMS49949_05700 [Alphaproteobacteria bacterium]|nr:hypothetical protein AGMMS49949_05700 [Alphaproteobacteria bacterium]GHS97686.1 hypothetical protein AGMMS50296_4870 [Alphaproteobacteria bacterium]
MLHIFLSHPHKILSLKQIAENLEKKGYVISDIEHQVRRPLNKIREKTDAPGLGTFIKFVKTGYLFDPEVVRIIKI